MRKISLEHVSVKIKQKKILDDITFDITEGETVAILGPNGAGKTTLMNAILNILKNTSTTIRNDFLDLPPYKVGVHIQGSHLNGLMKVKEVLHLFNFENADISEWLDKYNMKHVLNQRIATLSLGEKQKVLLLLTFQNNPEIVFLDEVTTGLDVQSRNNVLKLISQQITKQKKTLIMITHYLEEAEKLCDKFIFLKDGKLLDIGKKEELFSKYHLCKEVRIQYIDCLVVPKHLEIVGEAHNEVSIKVHNEDEMMDILNFIQENRKDIKNYEIINPTLERLYKTIIGEEAL